MLLVHSLSLSISRFNIWVTLAAYKIIIISFVGRLVHEIQDLKCIVAAGLSSLSLSTSRQLTDYYRIRGSGAAASLMNRRIKEKKILIL